jgi:26 proteasome complex subunit DSS1
MSAAPASGAAPTTKATTSDKTAASTKDVKPAAALEEDDEFEDFPVESTPPFLTLSRALELGEVKLKLTIVQ